MLHIVTSKYFVFVANFHPSLILTPFTAGINVLLAKVINTDKNTNHQQMHKESFIINRNTLLHVSTLLGHLQGEFSLCYTKVAASQPASQQARTADSSRLQYTIHSQQHILTQL
jgi:hypothetical protein